MAAAAKVYGMDQDLDSFVETLRLVVTQAAMSLAAAQQYGNDEQQDAGGNGEGEDEEDEGPGRDREDGADDEAAMAAEEAKEMTDPRNVDDDYYLVERPGGDRR
jgi:hypothetical protein